MTRSRRFWRQLLVLSAGGGLGFWIANFAISRTPIAAEYRAALSIAYVPMLLQAVVGGLLVGVGVSYVVLRYFEALPTKSPIVKSMLVSGMALAVVTLLVEVPAKFLPPIRDAWRLFLVGGLFNVVRILALGLVVGYLYRSLKSPLTG